LNVEILWQRVLRERFPRRERDSLLLGTQVGCAV
jgi:hypothetical protein